MNLKQLFKALFQLPQRGVLALIRLYQKTLSPDHGYMRPWFPGGYCKHTPSCSDYGHAAVKKYGVMKGGIKTAWRIIRCNPYSKGGFDPLP